MLRDGQQQIGKVLEISLTEVKYKKVDNIDGPTYSELKNNISAIKYKNGTKIKNNTKGDESEEEDESDYYSRAYLHEINYNIYSEYLK